MFDNIYYLAYTHYMSRAYQLRMADKRYKELKAIENEQNIKHVKRNRAIFVAIFLALPVFAAFVVSPYMGWAMVGTISLGLLSKSL